MTILSQALIVEMAIARAGIPYNVVELNTDAAGESWTREKGHSITFEISALEVLEKQTGYVSNCELLIEFGLSIVVDYQKPTSYHLWHDAISNVIPNAHEYSYESFIDCWEHLEVLMKDLRNSDVPTYKYRYTAGDDFDIPDEVSRHFTGSYKTVSNYIQLSLF